MTTTNSDNPVQQLQLGGLSFMDFLEYQPEAAYYRSPAGLEFAGRSPAAQRSYERSFGDIYNQWLGHLGGMIRNPQLGDPMTARWTDWLESERPFEARYTSQTPEMRGAYTGSYAPRTRQIYF